MSSYDPDEKPQSQDETSIHFEHDAGLSFTLVFPPKAPSSFSKYKPLARLYLEQKNEGDRCPGDPLTAFSTSNSNSSSNSTATIASIAAPGSTTITTDEPTVIASDSSLPAISSREDCLYWKGPVRVARSIKKAIQSYEGVLTLEKLDEIIHATTRASAAAYMHALFNTRDYAKAEVEDKLLAAGYNTEIVQELVQKAQEGNLINDERFSEVFIRSKIMEGWGPRKIQQALAKRGIVLDEVKGWPEEFIAQDQEVERAYALIKNRSALRKNPFEKSVRYLAAKGFAYDICKQAAQRLVEDLKSSEE